MNATARELVIRQPARYDETFRLVGDEDCGVGLDCRLCDRGGAPIAYLTHPDDRAYAGTDVQVVHTITPLLAAGEAHLFQAHPE